MIVNPKAKQVDKKVAFITGAVRGFGAVVRERFEQAGYFTAVTSLHNKHYGSSSVMHQRCDATSYFATVKFVKRILSRWGRIDVAVVNAGVGLDRLLIKVSEAEMDNLMAVNLKGFFATVKAVLPVMAEQGGGHIIVISSYVGSAGRAGQTIYSATKAGLLGAVKSMAKETGKHNIRINTVMPGFMDIGMGHEVDQSARVRAREENVLGRLADPEESAEFVVRLAGMQGVSGQQFNLDSRVLPWH